MVEFHSRWWHHVLGKYCRLHGSARRVQANRRPTDSLDRDLFNNTTVSPYSSDNSAVVAVAFSEHLIYTSWCMNSIQQYNSTGSVEVQNCSSQYYCCVVMRSPSFDESDTRLALQMYSASHVADA